MTCNTFNNQTSKYSISALTVDQITSQLYSFEELYNIQSDPSLQYDQDLIYATVGLTRAVLISIDPSGTTYPLVLERFKQSPILAPEYAEFLNFSQYDLTSVNTLLSSFSSTTLATTSTSTTTNVLIDVSASTPVTVTQYFEQLDLYYNDNYAASLSGGFCTAFGGQLLELASLASGAVNLINQLKNFSINDVLSRLNSIKDILYNLVDSLKEKLLQQINNIVEKIATFKNMILSTANAIGKKITQAKNFFSDLNMTNIKEKIEGIIAKMAGGYEEITPEVIAYILFRLCKLTEIVSGFMQSPVDGLKAVMNAYAVQSALFSNFSLASTAEAVRDGHFRRDPIDLANERDRAIERSNSSGQSTYVTKPYTAEEMQLANELRSATIEQIISDSYAAAKYLVFGADIKGRKDVVEWQNVTIGTYIRLFRVAVRMGVKFNINSAFRPPILNAQVDGADNSLHLYGQALDVSMRGRSEEFRNNFIRTASEEGYNGILTYQNFIHVDTRGNIYVAGSYNTRALDMHANNAYRDGIYKQNSGIQ